MLGPIEGGLGGQDARGWFPPSGGNASLSGANSFFADVVRRKLRKKFIRESSSNAASLVCLLNKKAGSLRQCVDYRGLNEGMIKTSYSLPLVKETFMQLSRAKIFTKLDIRGAYTLIWMRAGEEWKTACGTRYSLFESCAMPSNFPVLQQHFKHILTTRYPHFWIGFVQNTLTIYWYTPRMRNNISNTSNKSWKL